MQDYKDYKNPLRFRKEPPVISGEKGATSPAPAAGQKGKATPAAPERGRGLASRTVAVRIGMLVILAVSVSLLWWSVSNRLLPASRQLRDKATAMAQLQNEVQQLQLAWNEEEAKLTEQRYEQAQTLLFSGEDALVDWQGRLERDAEAHALQPAGTTAAPATLVTNWNLARVPVTLQVNPLEIIKTTNSGYRRLLNFTRTVETADKRIDLVDLVIDGNSNSVRQAKLVLEAWAKQDMGQ